MTEPSGDAYTQAVTTLLPYLLSHRSRLAAATASQAASTTGRSAAPAAFESATVSQTDTTQRSRRASAESMVATSDFGAASEAASAEVSSSGYSQTAKEDEAPDSSMHRRPQEVLASLQPEQRHRLSVLVDTAILKVHLHSCIRLNHCSGGIAQVQVSAEALHKSRSLCQYPPALFTAYDSEVSPVSC